MTHERGDTLVEVLIATAILGAAIVAGLGIMNYGFGLVLNSIERTQVQAAVNSQLSLAQYARDAYIRAGKDPTGSPGAQVWKDIMDNAANTHSQAVCGAGAVPSIGSGQRPFYINDLGTAYIAGSPTATTTIPTAGSGLWVEAVRTVNADPTKPNYIDFYVKACWQPIVGNTNQESRSAVRLYEP